jgi:hypothetical protein
MGVPSDWKAAVPVGVAAAPATFAVNVTDWPNVDGLRLEVTVVVVLPLLTV